MPTVKMMRNYAPETVDDKIKASFDHLGRLPKGAVVEMSAKDAKPLIKAGIVSADAAMQDEDEE